jgi:hypothetical protein
VVVGALDDRDRVDLHVTQVLERLESPALARSEALGPEQALRPERDSTGFSD